MDRSDAGNQMHAVNKQAGTILSGKAQIPGRAFGKLLASNLELSFWGGVDSMTGEIIDRHHPLSGQFLTDTILAIPGGRGSCSGSGVILQLVLNGKGPRAIICARREDIITLGVLVAKEVFRKFIPVVVLNSDQFKCALDAQYVYIDNNKVSTFDSNQDLKFERGLEEVLRAVFASSVELSNLDNEFLTGLHGRAAQAAMRIILQMADLQGASRLIDVSQVHIDGCVYTGPACLAFAQKLRDWGGKVLVPTTMNAISVDQRRWRLQGIDYSFGEPAEALAAAYTDMGARPTFTCTPYLLDSAPKLGDQVAWGESNAVVYANSVLGARTMKYPDFLDIAVALTGRAPDGGMYMDEHRKSSLCVKVIMTEEMGSLEDSFFPLLGYCVGGLAGHHIPVIIGIDSLQPSTDDLKAFGAAFATVASAPMFYMVGITPEAKSIQDATDPGLEIDTLNVTFENLLSCRTALNGVQDRALVELVSLGSPHFSITEITKLAGLCKGRVKSKRVAIVVTCGRTTYDAANQSGLVKELEQFGVQFVTDTCWCMIIDPIIPSSAKVIMTNSAKYAHYGPGLTGRRFCFGSLAECVQAACRSEA